MLCLLGLYVIQPEMLIVLNFVVDPEAIRVCALLSHCHLYKQYYLSSSPVKWILNALILKLFLMLRFNELLSQ